MDRHALRRLLASFCVFLVFLDCFVTVEAFSQPVGCDNVLGSTKTEDKCRVCGGDGSSCSLIRGQFDDDTLEIGYNDFLLIPVGATSIMIQQNERSRNFLAVRNAEGRYYFNGNWKVEFPKELSFAGTVFRYERNLLHGQPAPEILKARGPTTENLFIVLLYQEKNLGVSYEYAIPVKTASPNTYIWKTGDFEECSQTCGGGVHHRSVRCIREIDSNIVDERLCDPVLKPSVKDTCNYQPCPPLWKMGEWSECSRECGGGTQFRVVFCHQLKDGNTVLVPDDKCEQPKPLFMRSCNFDKECPEWVTGEWSECDSLCGTGSQNRSVECHSKVTGEGDSLCNPKEKPEDQQKCTLGPCEAVEWKVSGWSGCNESCNPQMESREVHCADEEGAVFPEYACEAGKRPELARPCPKWDICEPTWHASDWTECSVRCGNGVQSRTVICGVLKDDVITKIEDKNCDQDEKVDSLRKCSADCGRNTSFEPAAEIEFTTEFCFQLQDGGPCSNIEVNWYYDATDGICKEFYYGGCEGNKNRFKTRQECEKSCFNAQGVTPTISDKGEGCEMTLYGCCPDGRSADLTGCPCNTLPFGCCPDGHTPARTSDPRDCPCESQRHGCCLDGRTIARGPNHEGCPCDSTRFGCCQDGKTTAQGPEFEGCPCESTAYGCCADNYSPAKGPRFDGCAGVLTLKPKVSIEVCSFPKEPGPCRNYTIKWFFDIAYGGCSRFWYGGCDGNGNVFSTREECESVCVKREGAEACLLPVVAGSCDGKVLSWYYDAGSKTCETFTYGGCLGNNNRFATKTDCVEKCISNLPSPVTDSVCQLPHEIGPCNEFQERWYFDFENDQCYRFIYGGCKGNENNFGSFRECEKRCGRDTSSEPPTEIEFTTEFCFQLHGSGPCSNTEVNWYYDSTDGVCKEFYYGGCKGNRNRFKTRKECENSCFKAQDVCTLPAVKGPCSGSFAQWYYDKSQDDCFEFSFSGCKGNANRFSDKDRCQQRCKKPPVTTDATTSDVCSLPKEPGPCLGYYRAWYYDNSENACKSFIYGGCDGNENRFDRRRDCEQLCTKKTPKEPEPLLPDEPLKPDNEDVCRLPIHPGPCNEEHPRWFYDAQTQSCLPFVYGGCEGNKNRFKTAEICTRFCAGIKVKPGTEDVPYVTLPTSTTLTTCPASTCTEIQCPFGIEETFDVNECSSCRCSNPCEIYACPEGSRCGIEAVRASRDSVSIEPVCRRVQKPGICPSGTLSSGPRDCELRCRDDADCRGERKCCNNGCAFTCMPPADEPLLEAERPEPASILTGVNAARGEIGQPAELPCSARGWPKPTVTWWRDTTMLPLSSHKYEQLADYSLRIRSVAREDGALYSCHAHNGIGSGALHTVTLIVDSPPEEDDWNSDESEPPVPPFDPFRDGNGVTGRYS